MGAEQLWIVALLAGASRESMWQPPAVGALQLGESVQQPGVDLVVDQDGTPTIRRSSSAVRRRFARRTAQYTTRATPSSGELLPIRATDDITDHDPDGAAASAFDRVHSGRDTSLAMAAQWSSVEVDPVQLTKGRRRGNA